MSCSASKTCAQFSNGMLLTRNNVSGSNNASMISRRINCIKKEKNNYLCAGVTK